MKKNKVDDDDLTTSKWWCYSCCKDLQSKKCLEQHKLGRRHMKNEILSQPKSSNVRKRPRSSSLPIIDESDLFCSLRKGLFRNIIILTGAGVSTAAGVPDFRSPNGLFSTIRTTFGKRFPYVHESPESILSRDFVRSNPDIYELEVVPILEHIGKSVNAQPTDTHKFCEWLHEQGWLRRVYTQNVDGLHLHHSLDIEKGLVVECHGSMREGNIVLYGDDLPKRFYDCCDKDFPEYIKDLETASPVDLLLVFGTSLKVRPFCAIPNLAPRGCVRVLVNRSLEDCIVDNSPHNIDMYGLSHSPGSVRIGSRKSVTLRNLWTDRVGNKRWRQLLVEGDCDDFVQRFFASPEDVIK